MKLMAQPKDILMDLARCRERDLFALIVGVRTAYVLYTLFCTQILPLLLLLPPRFFVFDSGELLYDDDRFTGMRNWDSVHFFHIAKHGYSHENNHVFFPLVPLIIRMISYITEDAFPFLHHIAPVSLYMCMFNIFAVAFAGVLLRRLTLLTLLGPEAHDLVTRVNHYSEDKACHAKGAAGRRVKSVEEVRLEAAVWYRVEHDLAGTMIDSFPPIHSILTASECTPKSPKAARSTEQLVKLAWRVTGAAVLYWIVSPSTIFTVAVYTESYFSLFTFAGVYLLARYPSAVQSKDGGCCIFPFPHRTGTGTHSSDAEKGTGGRVDGDAQGANAPLPGIRWKQAATSPSELIAVLCFVIAALSRSNAFICGGFLLYPSFIRACNPRLYERRWSCIHGHYWHRQIEHSYARGGRSNNKADHCGGPYVVHTLYPPHGRVANPLRLLVLFLELVVVLTPFFFMNYHGWRVYVPMWSADERRLIGTNFLKFYGFLQKKYWNVGFLTSYTIVNSPNVVISAPIGLIVLYCSYHFYIKPSLVVYKKRQANGGSSKIESVQVPSPKCAPAASPSLQSLVLSANVVYLWVLCLIAFTLMHVQVANRFLMSCPALYWLVAFQVVTRPRSWVSSGVLAFSVLWALVGGMFFPNHLPWT